MIRKMQTVATGFILLRLVIDESRPNIVEKKCDTFLHNIHPGPFDP